MKFTKRLLLLLVVAFALSPAYAATKGNPPVAHWKFDEGGGATAYDESANNNDGTLTPGGGGSNLAAGQMWSRQGKIGSALECDGTDDYVSAGSRSLGITNSTTIALWAKFNTLSSYRTFVSFGGYVSGGFLFQREGAANKLRFAWAGSDTYDGPVFTTTGTWVHLVVVVSSGTPTYFYVNGQATAAARTGGSASFSATDPKTLEIGRRTDTTNQNVDGLIDDVRIYNYARTPEQVLQDYNAGFSAHLGAGTDPNEGNPPVGYWPLDENTGQYAYDRSGSGNNGTLGSTTGSDANDPVWALGKVGSALNFDGANDIVEVADSSSLNLTGDFSLSTWVKFDDVGAGPAANGWVCVVEKGTSASARYGLWRYYKKVSFIGDNTVVTSADDIFNIGAWYHLQAVHQTGGAVSIYVNGLLVKSGTATITAPAGHLVIGQSSVTGYSAWLDGLIDDVKIYNYARSAGQIAYDYNKGKPVAHYKFDEGTGAIARNEYSTADTGPAPVGWWRMDEGTGGTTADASGNGNTATLYPMTAGANTTTAAMWDQTGKIGPDCIEFDGTDDYVNRVATNWGIADAWSVSAWYKQTTAANNKGIWQIGDSLNSSEANAFKLVSNYVYMANSSGAYFKYYSGITTFTNTWTHAMVVWDGTNLKVYQNGVDITGSLTKINDNAGNMANTNRSLWIGIDTNNGGSTIASAFNGLIDDVRIYNYARTPEQIYNDYKTTHGTFVGDTKFVDGKINKALTFDGNGDYVDVPDSAEVRPAKALTLSCWVKHSAVSTAVYMAKQVGSSSSNSYALWYNGDNTLRGCAGDSSGVDQITYTWTPVVGQWYYLAYTFDDDANIEKLYVDGKEVFSDSNSKTMGYNDSPVTISYDFNGPNRTNGGYGINGLIDDARIYSYARSAEQVLQDFNAGATTRLGTQSAGEADPWGGALPVAHWSFDDNTGVAAYDKSGNGKNLTWQGTLGSQWTQGKMGSSGNFNGSDNQASINSQQLNFSTAITAEAWIYPTGSAHMEAVLGNLSSNGFWFVSEWCNPGCVGPYFYINGASGSVAAIGSISLMNYNAWNHLAATYDGSVAKVYVNGRQALSANGAAGNFNYNQNFAVGSRGDGAYKFQGKIDDVRIYNYARTQAQVAWDYNRGKPVGHWRMNEATSGSAVGSNTIKDDSGRGNHGTGSGSNLAWATGKFGGGLTFNGTNDYVDLGDISSFDFSNVDFAISGWFKISAYPTNSGACGPVAPIFRNNDWGYGVSINGTGYVSFNKYYTSSNGVGVSSASPVSINVWHHVVAVHTTSELRLYIDGKLSNTASSPSGAIYYGGGDTPEIGRLNNCGSANYYFSGLLDDIRVYNYARTAEQILQDYNNGASARLGD